MKRLLLAVLMLAGLNAHTQDLRKIEAEIQAEGKALYHSEWASWYGTDIFLEKCTDKKGTQGGYLSYDDGKGLINVFYSKGENPEVLSTINFGYAFDSAKYLLDTTRRKMNAQEESLYKLRKAALERINTDTIFKVYNNTSLNPVPLIYKNKKKVYVLTGPNVSGVVIIGNDYLIDFDKKNKITGVTKLHNTLLPFYFNSNETDSSKIQKTAVHSHVKGKDELISVTDICTLMLYAKFTTWKTHYVISDKYVSIWDCKKNMFVALTRKAWDRINKDQQERHPQKQD